MHLALHRPARALGYALMLLAAGFDAAGLLSLAACSSTEEPGALVPPTADQDPALPRLALEVDGRTRWLHLETFGDPSRPVVLVLPGGPGADYRLLLPLRELSNHFFLVMWDQHGCGLSERVSSRADLGIDSFDAEIAAVQSRFAPSRTVALIGHSFGADLAVRYAARHPTSVSKLVLVEPGPLTQNARDHRASGFVSAAVFEGVFWGNQVLTAHDHAEADYRLLGALRPGTQDFYCPGQTPLEFPLWRFGAYALEMVPREEEGLDYSRGIDAFEPRALLVAGSCGSLGAGFQSRYDLPSLPRADLVTIEGAGHITLFLSYAPRTVAAIRAYLELAP